MRLIALGPASAIATVLSFGVEAADYAYPPAAVGPPQYSVAPPAAVAPPTAASSMRPDLALREWRLRVELGLRAASQSLFRPLRVPAGLLRGPAPPGALRRPLRFAWFAGLLWHQAPAGSGDLLRHPRASLWPLRATSLFRWTGPYALDDRPATLRHVIAPTAANMH